MPAPARAIRHGWYGAAHVSFGVRQVSIMRTHLSPKRSGVGSFVPLDGTGSPTERGSNPIRPSLVPTHECRNPDACASGQDTLRYPYPVFSREGIRSSKIYSFYLLIKNSDEGTFLRDHRPSQRMPAPCHRHRWALGPKECVPFVHFMENIRSSFVLETNQAKELSTATTCPMNVVSGIAYPDTRVSGL